jgi:putative hemolysin
MEVFMNALQEVPQIQNESRASEIYVKPYRMLLDKFKPRIRINIERDDYIIKTAETGAELEETLRLRHDVFYKEIIGKKLLFEIDIDRFDTRCDHLIIIDRKTEEIVGTYRLISSVFSSDFYSEGEFDLDDIKRLDGVKLELGRACIDRRYRNSQTIVLLWLGLNEYMNKIQAKYLFGCSSVQTIDFKKIAVIQRYVRQHHYTQVHIRVKPNKKCRIKDLSAIVRNLEPSSVFEKKAARLMPSLLNTYLAIGAQICGEPAYDREFKCMDYLTILNVEAMNHGYVDKLFGTC